MIWNLIGAAIIVWLGHKLVDVLKSGQQFAMYMMWYGLGRTWIESIRINYSTIILGLRVNVWTAIIVFLAGCVSASWKSGPPRNPARWPRPRSPRLPPKPPRARSIRTERPHPSESGYRTRS